jgi:hypothetical protein
MIPDVIETLELEAELNFNIIPILSISLDNYGSELYCST